MDVGNIVVQKDTPNLTALTSEITSNTSGFDCSSSTQTKTAAGVKAYGTDTGKKDGSAKIFASNVTGIGFAIGAAGYYIFWVGNIIGSGWFGTDWVLASANTGADNFTISAKLMLFKTGDITSGNLSGKIGTLISSNGIYPTVWGPEIPIYITGTVTKIACSLNSTSINVPLGDISASKFTGPGITLGDKGFDIGLTCDKEAKINVALAGTQNSETTDTSVLALTNAGQTGTASGLGVQLLYGGTPLKINNNILLKTSPGGQETLPFTARYYQTKTSVTPGKANSSATLNITYQ
ncbi:MAG: fimbrial protein [Serratia liquefaciens]|nr:fimbrial protein [Serratia liquefaciens]